MAKTLFVRSGRTDNRVALWDVDDLHPTESGQIFVSGNRIVEVGRTVRVRQALRDGALIEVERKGTDDDEQAKRVVAAERKVEKAEENVQKLRKESEDKPEDNNLKARLSKAEESLKNAQEALKDASQGNTDESKG